MKLFKVEISTLEDSFSSLLVAESLDTAKNIAEDTAEDIEDDAVTDVEVEEVVEVDGYRICLL